MDADSTDAIDPMKEYVAKLGDMMDGVAPYGDWTGKTSVVLTPPTVTKDADADRLTWHAPHIDVPVGACSSYAHSSDGKPCLLDVWSDGRVNFYYSCWSSRRHRRGASIRVEVWWRYKDSKHPLRDMDDIGFSMYFRPKPQGRHERLPKQYWLTSIARRFADLNHNNVETIFTVTTTHHG